MHQLLGTLRSADLVQSDGAGRHEPFTLTKTGAKRLVGASAAVAAVEERMLATFDAEQRRRLYADLAACADALSSRLPRITDRAAAASGTHEAPVVIR